jgi:hypothetical protein
MLQDGARRHRVEAQALYRFGRSPDWLKKKNPEATAVKPRRGRGLGQMTRTHSLPRERWGEK